MLSCACTLLHNICTWHETCFYFLCYISVAPSILFKCWCMNRCTCTKQHLGGVFVHTRAYQVHLHIYVCAYLGADLTRRANQSMTGCSFPYKLLLNAKGRVGVLLHSFSSPRPLCIQPWYTCTCRYTYRYRQNQLQTFWSIFRQSKSKWVIKWIF